MFATGKIHQNYEEFNDDFVSVSKKPAAINKRLGVGRLHDC